MFGSRIARTPFVSNMANEMLGSIGGDYYDGDCSFVSTLRALLYSRIPIEDYIKVGFYSSRYQKEIIRDNAARAVMNTISKNTASNEIYIHSFCNGIDENDNYAMDFVKENFEKFHSGYKKVDKVTAFFRKSFPVLCYINEDDKSVYIYVKNLTVKKMHYLQCAIFAYLPWYFEPNKGISDLEMKLIKSLMATKSDEYADAITQIANKINFRSSYIKKHLLGIESKIEEAELSSEKQKQLDIINHINRLNGSIREALEQKNEIDIKILGLSAKIKQNKGENSELMNYFLRNKHLYLETTSNNSIQFACGDTLEFFDEEMAEQMINNKSSYVYDYTSCSVNDEDLEAFMRAVFVERTLKIQICAAYRLYLSGGVSALDEHNYSEELDSYMRNPHIDGYSCMGNYTMAINQCLERHDYIMGIEQCLASAKSLNFGDSVVMELFMKTVCGRRGEHRRCVVLPDGSLATVPEAIEYLKGANNG